MACMPQEKADCPSVRHAFGSIKPVGFLNRRVFSTEDTMHATADQELLRRYAEHGAEEAFTALVHRHLNLVWAAARRTTGNADQARDVAQTVFTDLARKAKTLPRETVVAGWRRLSALLEPRLPRWVLPAPWLPVPSPPPERQVLERPWLCS